jgi:hypothetical protein
MDASLKPAKYLISASVISQSLNRISRCFVGETTSIDADNHDRKTCCY